MVNNDYIGLGLAIVLIAIGVPAASGKARSTPRHVGWLVLLNGAATLLYVVLKSRDVPGESWLRWVVPLLSSIGLLIAWRGNRRDKTDRLRQARPSEGQPNKPLQPTSGAKIGVK